MFPVWISELSRRAGVPVATVKYYLREGLLPPGETRSATRAAYDDGHVRRLRLIRALVDVAGMRLDQVREVLRVVDDEAAGVLAALGSAHTALSPEPAHQPSVGSTARVAALVRERGWHLEPDGRHARALAAALDALDVAEQPLAEPVLAAYADGAAIMAAADLAELGDRLPEDAATFAVTGTLLAEPVVVLLRRMAQEDLARRTLGGG